MKNKITKIKKRKPWEMLNAVSWRAIMQMKALRSSALHKTSQIVYKK
jgi:hypothetical protein